MTFLQIMIHPCVEDDLHYSERSKSPHSCFWYDVRLDYYILAGDS